MFQVIDDEKDLHDYKSFLEHHGDVYITQSPEWAHVKNNWACIRFVETLPTGEICVAGQLLYIFDTKLNSNFYYLPRGPVVDFAKATTENVLDFFRNVINYLSVNLGPGLFRCDPHWNNADPGMATLFETVTKELHASVRKYPDKTFGQPPFTMVGKVEGMTPEEWVMTLKGKRRNRLNWSLKNGAISFVTRDEKYIDLFYDLMKETATRQNITFRPREYFHRLFATYENAFMAVAAIREEGEGTPLSMSLNVPYNGTLFNLYAGNKLAYTSHRLPFVMNCEMFYEACRLHLKKVDLCGVFHPDNRCPLHEFKTSLVGDEGLVAFVGEFDVTIPNLGK